MPNEMTALSHHGIKGQKWGVRRFQSKDGALTPAGRSRYLKESKQTRDLKETRAYLLDDAKKAEEKAKQYDAQGKTKKAKLMRDTAEFDRIDAADLDSEIRKSQRKDNFRADRKAVSESRQTGHKLVTNIIAGPFANRTYNSVLAAGGSRVAAMGVTAAAGLIGGPIGHLAVSALYTSSAGDNSLSRDMD